MAIAEKIKEIISKEGLAPGTRLPTERDLAEQFGVNRATVGEALNLLDAWGLISRRVGRGTFVKEIQRSVVGDSMERYFTFASCSYEDLMELRGFMEPNMAALAARRATFADLALVEEKVVLMEEGFTQGDYKVFSAYDMEFHEALALATHNELIITFMYSLNRVLKNWLEHWTGQGQISEEGMKSHRLILEAVAARSQRRAYKIMEEHLAIARRYQPEQTESLECC